MAEPEITSLLQQQAMAGNNPLTDFITIDFS